MASEMRRMAQALVERRSETIESLHGADDSRARLASALAAARMEGAVVFEPTWREEGGHAILEAGFAPSPGTQRTLRLFSFALSALVACSAWLIVVDSGEGALRFLVPLFTGLAVLGFPFVAVALGSRREAEEARILKAARRALRDEGTRPA